VTDGRGVVEARDPDEQVGVPDARQAVAEPIIES
jgi:hypothetical protein